MIYNIDAEQELIGSILFEPGLIKETRIKTHHLSDKRKAILEYMYKVDKKGQTIDMVSLATEMGDVIQQIGISYITEMAGSIPTVSNFKQTEQFIIDAYKVRKAYESANEYIRSVSSRTDPLLITKLSQQITEIEEQGQTETRSWKDALIDMVNESFEERTGLSGVDTGFNDLNKMTDGLQGNNLIIIGARPSMGKTAFALNIGANASMMTDARVDIFSLETPEKRLTKRIISSVGNIDAGVMRNYSFDERTREKFMQTVGMVESLDLHIHDQSTITVEEIRAKVREGNRQAKKESREHIVIIDYLQLITYAGPMNNPVQQIGHISRQLKTMAGDFDIPVIALSQLSRGLEQRQDKRPMMSDLRDSGSIEQDADVVMFLYRDDYYDAESEKQNITEIITAKNRDGAVGTVELVFIKEYNKFVNLDHRYSA